MPIINFSPLPMKTNVLPAVNTGCKASIGLTIKRFFQAKNTAFEDKEGRKVAKSVGLNFATDTLNRSEVEQQPKKTTKDSFALHGFVKRVINGRTTQAVSVKTDLIPDSSLTKDLTKVISLDLHKYPLPQAIFPVLTNEAIFILDSCKSLSPINEAKPSYKPLPALTNFQSTLQERKNTKLKSSTRLKVVHRFDGSIEMVSAGHLVISGCIADVCAELERMAQYE